MSKRYKQLRRARYQAHRHKWVARSDGIISQLRDMRETARTVLSGRDLPQLLEDVFNLPSNIDIDMHRQFQEAVFFSCQMPEQEPIILHSEKVTYEFPDGTTLIEHYSKPDKSDAEAVAIILPKK